MLTNLARALRERQVILFAGSGLSAGLGVADWSGLMRHIGKELKYDPDLFLMSADYLTLAQYYKLQTGSIGPLRSWMNTEFDVDSDKLAKSKAHDLIVKLDFPIIYTTNFDRNIENAFAMH